MIEKYFLTWNDFQSNIVKSFSRLRNEDSFYDVTLVSDDQKEVSAHKLVLSTCSEYFKNIFKNRKNSHPILCLEGISSSEMNNVLDYIYNGAVQIHQDDLDRFLKIAQRLKLEGLIGEQNVEGEERVNAEQLLEKEETKVWDIIPNKKEISNTERNQSPIVVYSEQFESIEDLDQKIEDVIERDVGRKWKCTICEKIFRDKTDVKFHAEVHFDGISFPCQACEKTFRSRMMLKKHISAYKHF